MTFICSLYIFISRMSQIFLTLHFESSMKRKMVIVPTGNSRFSVLHQNKWHLMYSYVNRSNVKFCSKQMWTALVRISLRILLSPTLFRDYFNVGDKDVLMYVFFFDARERYRIIVNLLSLNYEMTLNYHQMIVNVAH